MMLLLFALYFSSTLPSIGALIGGNARLAGFGDKLNAQPHLSYFEEKGLNGRYSNFGGGNSGGGSQMIWGYGPEDGPDKWGGICRAGIRNSMVQLYL